MKTAPLEYKKATESDNQAVKEFLDDLVSICNKHRIWIAINTIGRLRIESSDGILLDVAGFYLDEKNKILLPTYTNRLSG